MTESARLFDPFGHAKPSIRGGCRIEGGVRSTVASGRERHSDPLHVCSTVECSRGGFGVALNGRVRPRARHRYASLKALAAQETRLLQPVPAPCTSDIADDLPAVPVQMEFLAESPLLGRLQFVDAAIRILEREERRHIPFIDNPSANLKD